MNNLRKTLLFVIALLAFAPMAWAQNIVSVDYVDENGTPQNVNATSLDEIANVNPDGATIGTSGFTNWYVVQGDNVVMNGQLGYNGGINLILCDGAKLTINATNVNAIQSLDDIQNNTRTTFTIYGQTNGTGQLVVSSTSNDPIYNYHGMITENLTINGGVLNVTSDCRGIYAQYNNIVINRGTVTVNAGWPAIEGQNVTINGGIVSAIGDAGIKNGAGGQTILGYTNLTDQITASSYELGAIVSSVNVKEGQYLISDNGIKLHGWLNEETRNAVAGHTLSPYTPTEWSGSGNNANDPYIIATVDDLELLSLRTNGDDNDYSGKYFKLGADIAFTYTTDWNDTEAVETNFSPIGSFSGYFNGDGHTISGLRVGSYNGSFAGLFRELINGAHVTNLTISDSRIRGASKVGGIAGQFYNGNNQVNLHIENCHVTNTVAIQGYGSSSQDLGGIVGRAYNGMIIDCISEATISKAVRDGYSGSITNAGGIVGEIQATVMDCRVVGANITADNHYGTIAGGNGDEPTAGVCLHNYYANCTINNVPNVINMGRDGQDEEGYAESMHTIDLQNAPNVVVTTDTLWTFNGVNYWKRDTQITLSGGLDDTPSEGCIKTYYIDGVALRNPNNHFDKWNEFNIGQHVPVVTIGEIHNDWELIHTGDADDPYLIYFPDQLDLLASRVQAQDSDVTSGYPDKYFKLMADLEYDPNVTNNYTAIGGSSTSHPFRGHFNGNQKTISGIRISGENKNQGIFGAIMNAEVTNLYVENAEISGNWYVGGITGICINSCTVSGCRVTNTTLHSAGNAPIYFGGIVGYNAASSSSLSNNIADGVTMPAVNQSGAITGGNYNGPLTSNYYINCLVGENVTGVGCNGNDVTTNNGAVSLHTITVPNTITNHTTATINYGGTDYWAQGTTITLSGGLNGDPAPGCVKAYFVNGNAVTLPDNNFAFSDQFAMPAANAVVTTGEIHNDWELTQTGTNDDPYLIYFPDQLDLLASRVQAQESAMTSGYPDKYFKLMADLEYAPNVASNYTAIGGGSASHPFRGHFNGNQKTIRGIRISGENDYQGIFGAIMNAEVTNLYVEDAEISGNRYVGGIVGTCIGNCTVSNCRVKNVTLSGTTGSQYFGGIVGNNAPSSGSLSNNIADGVTMPAFYLSGAITGEINTNLTLISNYYINCLVGENTTGVGYYYEGHGADITNNNGAVSVHTISVNAQDVTVNTPATLTYNTTNYWVYGTLITLGGGLEDDAPTGYQKAYFVNGEAVLTSDLVITNVFTMPAADVIITVGNAPADWVGAEGTEEDPYEIYTVEQWDLLASRVNDGTNTYDDKHFKLMNDISVTTMVGNSDDHTFKGTFDGNGHTLTVNYTSDGPYTAPFRHVDNATVKNLHVDGTIATSHQFAAGIIAHVKGNTNITNCRSSVTINSSIDGDGTHGGLVALIQGDDTGATATIEGCVFDGSLQGNSTTGWGGFVGWTDNQYYGASHITIENSVFAPTSLSVGSDSKTFTRYYTNYNPDYITITNCYYTSALGDPQGKQSHSISAGEDVTVAFSGDATEFNVSQITAHAGTPGLEYNGNLIAGSSEQVILNLNYTGTVNPGYTVHFYRNDTYLIPGTENPYTVEMENRDALISASTGVIDWTTAYAGTADDPYLIGNLDQWISFCSKINNESSNSSYRFAHYKLIADILISESFSDLPSQQAGRDGDKEFRGTFDGDGHTLTVYYTDMNDYNYCAPFRMIQNATIKNLHVTGYIYKFDKKHVGGIVGQAFGTNYIINCRSSVDILVHTNGDGSSGGIIGDMRDSNDPDDTYLIDCLFDGKLRTNNGTTKWGGLVGWVHEEPDAYFINCLFAPQEVTSSIINNSDSQTFARGDGDRRVNNCYYKTLIANHAQGATDAASMSNDDLLASLGNGWEIVTEGGVQKVVPIMGHYQLEGDGTEDSPYIIANDDDWESFAKNVYTGESYSGKYIRMTGDASSHRMAANYIEYSTINSSNSGSYHTAFAGTFDGNGHTLTINAYELYAPFRRFSAPFKCVDGATIKNLHTTGYILGSTGNDCKLFGGIVGASWGTTNILNCVSSATVSSLYFEDAALGGLVGAQKTGTLTIDGCAFTGELGMYGNPKNCAGIMRYQYDGNCRCTISNTVFAPTRLVVDNGTFYTFTRGNINATITNCYYTQTVGTSAQGKQAHSITGGEGVIVENGHTDVTEYTVSGITAYGTGIKYDNTLYAGHNDAVVLLLSVAPGYTYSGTLTFHVDNGDFNYNEMGPSLLAMPDADVIITADLAPLITLDVAGYSDSDNDRGGYVLIASPVGTVSPENVGNMLENSYDLYRFNQAADLEWENYKENEGDHFHFNLEPGKGYLYANSEDVTLLFPGTPYTGSGEVTLSKTDNTSADFQGWNLVGNPFNQIAYIADGRDFYTMNASGSEIEAATSTSIEAMEGIFVIANEDGETLTFTTTQPANNGGAKLSLNLSHANNGGVSTGSTTAVIDRAIVRFNEGDLLPKFQLNRNSTKVYIPMDGQDYAVVRSEGMGEIPVNFKARENGTYMLSLSSEEVEFSYLHLIDNMTGNDVDLLQTPSYSFNAKTTDYESRFKLVFVTKDGPSTESDAFAFNSNGRWFISNEGSATLQVVDVNGRILSSETVNGSVSKAINAAPGVYVIRLINGNDVKTQKIVVR